LPYALLLGAFSVLFGYLPMGFGVPWWLALPVAAAACVGTILFLGAEPTAESKFLTTESAAAIDMDSDGSDPVAVPTQSEAEKA